MPVCAAFLELLRYLAQSPSSRLGQREVLRDLDAHLLKDVALTKRQATEARLSARKAPAIPSHSMRLPHAPKE